MSPNQKETPSTCIIFLTHRINQGVIETAEALYRSCHNSYDIFILLDERAGSFDGYDRAPTFPIHVFSILDLRERYSFFGNPKSADINPGNAIFPLLDFSHHQQYGHYWLVEFDVRYSGEWIHFFSQFNDDQSDLLGTSIHDHAFKPNWYWWQSLKKPPFHLKRKKRMLRGFFPVLRVSKRALELLEYSTKKGWSGHYEVLLPTLLREKGLTISDIGGNGDFTPKERVGRNYVNTPKHNELAPGTFVCPPAEPLKDYIPNMLYHAIKS